MNDQTGAGFYANRSNDVNFFKGNHYIILLIARGQNGLTATLKQQVKDLKEALEKKNEEYEAMKKNIKYTKYQEIEVAKKTLLAHESS